MIFTIVKWKVRVSSRSSLQPYKIYKAEETTYIILSSRSFHVLFQAQYSMSIVWSILIIFIWIIMYAHLKQHLSEQLSSGTLPPACLSTYTCFGRIHDKILAPQRWIPASQSPLANCSIWQCGFPDWPVFPLKPEQIKTTDFDGRISGHVARIHHLVHALAATYSLPPAFISTLDRGPRGWVSDPLINDLRKQLNQVFFMI